jgi:hypothetical protein
MAFVICFVFLTAEILFWTSFKLGIETSGYLLVVTGYSDDIPTIN